MLQTLTVKSDVVFINAFLHSAVYKKGKHKKYLKYQPQPNNNGCFGET